MRQRAMGSVQWPRSVGFRRPLELECAAGVVIPRISRSGQGAQYSAGVRCAYANSCDEFGVCLETGDDSISCEEFCDRTALCRKMWQSARMNA